MSKYLIALSIGPVQGFIAAARKTRDLWFGSYVLSEISKAAAMSFHQRGAVLIFPAPEDPEEDLKPDSKLNVANKLLVKLEAGDKQAVVECLEMAKQDAENCWKDLAQKAISDRKLQQELRTDIWNKQVKDVLELFGAWVQVSDYQTARDRVDTLLAARKMTREFKPAALSFAQQAYFGLPKSSLDAARESVLKKGINKRARRKLGLGQNEQLDCPGVVKRLGGVTEQFPPVTRIALETWLNQIPENTLKEMRDCYQPLLKHDLATPVRRSGQYEKFPYDGALLFPDRIAAERQALEDDETEALEDLKQLEKVRQTVCKVYGDPESYYAILVADGDKMGAYLDSCKELGDHQKVSRALDTFARNTHEVIEKHQGACVYSGGDDVMALLPIHAAVQCAEALRTDFNEKVKDLPDDKAPRPTLSVGLGLAHVMTPFSVALEVGREAEKLAKAKTLPKAQQGNALAMIADVRSGVRLQVRGQWESGIVEALTAWQTAYKEDRLPATTPYELQQAAERMAWADDESIVLQEIVRVLKKKRESGGDKEIAEQLIQDIETAIKKHCVEPVLQQLRIARWLASKH